MGYKKADYFASWLLFWWLERGEVVWFSVSQLLLWSIVINPAAKTVPLWPNQWATKKSKYVVAVEVKWEGNADLLCIQRINIHTQLESLWVAEHWKEREQKWGTGRFFSSSIPQRDKLWVLSIQTVECVTRGNVAVGTNFSWKQYFLSQSCTFFDKNGFAVFVTGKYQLDRAASFYDFREDY